MANNPTTVGLFVTCLVDLFRPAVGFAAVNLLERADCDVVVPPNQTCCGQPAYNSGDRSTAKAIATMVIDAFSGCDYVVVPSGSCAAMLRHHFPALLVDEHELGQRATALAQRTYELVTFLTEIRGVSDVDVDYPCRATYHDACSGLRELGIRAQPRALLDSVRGLELVELEDTNACCGFGGTFCVKYPEISNQILADKVAAIALTGADVVLSGDLGCLINIAGRFSRAGINISVRHVAEILAGMTEPPPIVGI